MNLILAISSLFHGIIIAISTNEKPYASKTNPCLVYLTQLGVISSLWNHGTTNRYAVIADRIIMCAAFIYYLKKTRSHEMHTYNRRLVQQTAIMYLYAKYNYPQYIHTIFHIWTHMNATYTYWRILVVEDKICRSVTA